MKFTIDSGKSTSMANVDSCELLDICSELAEATAEMQSFVGGMKCILTFVMLIT